MRSTITFDTKDIAKFEKTCKVLGDKTAMKAARKAAQKGSNVVGKAIRQSAPVGKTGQLKRGFKKKKEKSAKKGKFVYDYAMDSAKNDVFQKPIKNPGILGGKNKTGYYPASVEYGFLTKAPGGGYQYKPGEKRPSRKVEGQHFVKKASETSEPAAVDTMKQVLNEELDKEWSKK